jgi:8-oxo-dGTP pyrophosphatase MutT (NUDIX family)
MVRTAQELGLPAEVAVFVTRRRGEVLLLRRVPSKGGYWHVVAGGIEPGESPREAAVRELREETGLVAELGESVEVVEHVPRSQPVVGIPVTCYRVGAPDGWEPVYNEEHDAHRWLPPSEAAAALVWPETARALRALVPDESQ